MKNKFNPKQKIALAVFMESVPKLIELWRSRAPDVTFDEFLLTEYQNHTKKISKERKNQ